MEIVEVEHVVNIDAAGVGEDWRTALLERL
jgi:hypothetical protein